MRIYLSTTTRTGCKNWLQEQVATGTKEMFSWWLETNKMNLCWLFVSTISFILCQEDCEDPVFGDCGDIDYYDSENECIKLNEIKVDVTEKKKTLNVVDLR